MGLVPVFWSFITIWLSKELTVRKVCCSVTLLSRHSTGVSSIVRSENLNQFEINSIVSLCVHLSGNFSLYTKRMLKCGVLWSFPQHNMNGVLLVSRSHWEASCSFCSTWLSLQVSTEPIVDTCVKSVESGVRSRACWRSTSEPTPTCVPGTANTALSHSR